jgi:hypothetical protein
MWQYWSHFRYTMIHKYYVFIECVKEGIIWRGIVHDLSKFSHSEFSAYADYYFNSDGTRKNVSKKSISQESLFFEDAWNHHQFSNDHHWQYWTDHNRCGNMPLDAITEMICDWKGAGLAQGNGGVDNPLTWYKKNRDSMTLHPRVRDYIDKKIGYS